MSDCALTRRLKEQGRIVTTEDWLKRHREHGAIEERKTERPYPPGLRVLVCECGATHWTMSERTEARA